jgi:signal transduction histidine kinase
MKTYPAVTAVSGRRGLMIVRDEGPGLDAGHLDRIFAAYEQATRKSVGVGLGLYLARKIARLHGGDLWAESRGRPNGRTFILALPMPQQDEHAPGGTSSRGRFAHMLGRCP